MARRTKAELTRDEMGRSSVNHHGMGTDTAKSLAEANLTAATAEDKA